MMGMAYFLDVVRPKGMYIILGIPLILFVVLVGLAIFTLKRYIDKKNNKLDRHNNPLCTEERFKMLLRIDALIGSLLLLSIIFFICVVYG